MAAAKKPQALRLRLRRLAAFSAARRRSAVSMGVSSTRAGWVSAVASAFFCFFLPRLLSGAKATLN